jgi:hypothetical protein
MDRLIQQHFSRLTTSLLAISDRFDLPDHGDIKGYCREALISDFFETHCPTMLEYSTGEIIDSHENRSGQIDVLITSKVSPKLPLLNSAKLVFSECVVASVEVKSTLTTASDWSKSSHLKSIFQQTRRIKKMVRKGVERPPRPIPVLAICFQGPTIETLLKHVIGYSLEFHCSPYEFCPDVISVLSRGYSVCHDNGLIARRKNGPPLVRWESDVSMALAIPYIYITRCSEMFFLENRFSNVADYFKDI